MGEKGFESCGGLRAVPDRARFFYFACIKICDPGSPFLPSDSEKAVPVRKGMAGILCSTPALDSTLRQN